MSVHTPGESNYDEWARLVATSPDGSIYATAEYLDSLCVAAGGKFRILVARRGEELVGCIPFYERCRAKGWLSVPGCFFSSRT